MQLNTTTDYALKMLVYLAKVDRTASSQEIAAAMKIPPKYITNIVGRLKEAGYVRTLQGAGGGYQLVRSPSDITLRDIVVTVEGEIRINRCQACEPHCALYDVDHCPLNETYSALHELIENAFRSVTVADLARKMRFDSPTNT